MATRSPYMGFLLLDSRFNPENEAAQGAGANDSTYNQAGPVPGRAELADERSLWRPAIVGAQSVDLALACIRGGFPGRDGASVIYRDMAETEEWRGWDEPNTIAGWSAPTPGYHNGTAWNAFTAVTIPATQVVVVAALEDDGRLRIFRYDPRTEAWENGFDFNDTAGWNHEAPVILTWDEVAGRLLLFTGHGSSAGDPTQLAYYSDDLGDTWQIYAQGYLPAASIAAAGAVATQPREAWLRIHRTGANHTQLSSIDGGQTWTEVDTTISVFHTTGVFGRQFDAMSLAGGGYLVVYLDEASGGEMKSRRLATADSRLSDQDDVDVSGATTYTSVAACVDVDGIVYAFGVRNAWAIDVYRSTDDGLTWTVYDWGVASGGPLPGTPTYVLRFAVAAGGSIHLGHTATDCTTDLEPWGMFKLGGWSSVESGSGGLNELGRHARVGGGDTSNGLDGKSWAPIDEPDNMGWVLDPGSVGTTTFANGPFMQVTTVANDMVWVYSAWTDDNLIRGSCAVQMVSYTQGVVGDGPAMVVRYSDGTHSFEAQVDFSLTAVTARDAKLGFASPLGTVAIVTTTAPVHVRWMFTHDGAGGATFSAWMRALGTTEWTAICDKAALDDGGAAGAFRAVVWGHTASATTAGSRWYYATATPGGDWQSGTNTALERASTGGDVYTLGHLGLSWGHSIPADSAQAYPLPDATSTTEDVGRISAKGRARKGDQADIATAYTHGMRLTSPAVAPSPSRYWQSLDSSLQRVVYDLGSQQWIGAALGLVLVNCEGRLWYLECDNGAGGWETLATADLALGVDLLATRNGSVLLPRTGTTAIAEYFGEGRLVGGYAICSVGGAQVVARRIIRSSAGWWTDDATVQRVRLTLEGVDGTEDTATAICTLVAPSGVLVYYPTSSKIRRRWRWRSEIGQVTPSGGVRAGIVGIGRVAAIGAEPGWDWARRRELVRSVTRDRSGTPTVKRRGNPRTTWSYAWPDAVDLHDLRNGGADMIAATGGMAIGSAEDAWHSLWGWMENEMQSGQMPSVLLVNLPDATGMILNPDLWAYGLLMVDSHGVTGIHGREGESEVVRLESPTFEELR